jgi:DNA helicase-2/ATP-dependent DNA helicase PcrA
MSVSRMELEQEKNKLNKILDQIQVHLKEAQSLSQEHKDEVKTARKWMWEDLTRDVSKFENALDLVQHGLDLYRQERVYLFSNSLVHKLEKIIPSPYFGRIDFHENGVIKKEHIYIGISALTDKDTGEMLIYDWRAPISSMFYDVQLGEAEYTCPEGIIDGEILLKRQYKIIKGKLLYMFDSNLQIGDDVLQEMLSKNTDDKMKTIVTTIQREQNQIIRDGQHKLLIVQGSAGSGKTSIALQRVAYLLYKHRETINADHIVIFSPNQLFNDYISDVLPELGEENMLQTTFQEYTERTLPPLISFEDKYDQLEYLFSAQKDSNYYTRLQNIKFKASSDFLQMIKNYISLLENGEITFKNISYRNKVLISKEELSVLFNETFSNLPLCHRLDEMVKRVKVVIKSFQLEMIKNVNKKLLLNPKYIGTDEEISKYSRAIVKKRLMPLKEEIDLWKIKYALESYRRLFQDKPLFLHLSKGMNVTQEWEKICNQSHVSLEKSYLLYEDVAPFILFKGVFEGIQFKSTIRHCIIDEGQDYTPLHFEIFRQLFPRSSFTILGDLNQSIQAETTSDHYQSIIKSLAADKATLIQLNKSYRSTREIVEFSKELLVDGEGIASINRSGSKPQVIKVELEQLIPEAIMKDIVTMKSKGYQSIAIICKTAKVSEEVYQNLNGKLNLHLIKKVDKVFTKGIVVIPAYLAKGLEFDAVFIYDAGNEKYGHEGERKLLYTACTRALHQLHIYYSGELTPFIKEQETDLYHLIKLDVGTVTK